MNGVEAVATERPGEENLVHPTKSSALLTDQSLSKRTAQSDKQSRSILRDVRIHQIETSNIQVDQESVKRLQPTSVEGKITTLSKKVTFGNPITNVREVESFKKYNRVDYSGEGCCKVCTLI